MEVTRAQVLRFRYAAQGLGRESQAGDTPVLDLGVQDTGPGVPWALGARGRDVPTDRLLYAWTFRGAPHAYRRTEAAEVTAATAPFDEQDAAKRVFDAAKPLRAAGISVLDALDEIAAHLRDIVRAPTVKGDASRQLSERLPGPYLRECRRCEATHTYEQPFRLGALRGGLELEPGTSPPVLRRIEGWSGPSRRIPTHLDPVRAVLRLLGPATPAQVAGYLDAPVATVKRRWPDDTTEVVVDGQRRSILDADLATLTEVEPPAGVRLLGPFDLFLQARDRELLVPEEAARADLWRVLGRPGAVLVDHEPVGTWRPRTSGSALRLEVVLWDGGRRPAALDEEAELMATVRGARFAGYVDG